MKMTRSRYLPLESQGLASHMTRVFQWHSCSVALCTTYRRSRCESWLCRLSKMCGMLTHDYASMGGSKIFRMKVHRICAPQFPNSTHEESQQ
jgi:hypothetical protein